MGGKGQGCNPGNTFFVDSPMRPLTQQIVIDTYSGPGQGLAQRLLWCMDLSTFALSPGHPNGLPEDQNVPE